MIILWVRCEIRGNGEMMRHFIYAADLAAGVLPTEETYNKPESVNIGTRFEIKVKHLAELIFELRGFRGKVAWHACNPDG